MRSTEAIPLQPSGVPIASRFLLKSTRYRPAHPIRKENGA